MINIVTSAAMVSSPSLVDAVNAQKSAVNGAHNLVLTSVMNALMDMV
jgi:hypothetical protein